MSADPGSAYWDSTQASSLSHKGATQLLENPFASTSVGMGEGHRRRLDSKFKACHVLCVGDSGQAAFLLCTCCQPGQELKFFVWSSRAHPAYTFGGTSRDCSC